MAKRQSMHIPGLVRHKNPISHCTRIGNILFSGAINGYDPETGALPPDLDSQVHNAFANLRTLVEGAGFSLGDVGKMTVYMKNAGDRSAVNREWVAMFPDENDRPARHAVPCDLAGGVLIQLEVIAVA